MFQRNWTILVPPRRWSSLLSESLPDLRETYGDSPAQAKSPLTGGVRYSSWFLVTPAQGLNVPPPAGSDVGGGEQQAIRRMRSIPQGFCLN